MYETYSTEVTYNSADFRHAIQTWTFSTKTYCLENFVMAFKERSTQLEKLHFNFVLCLQLTAKRFRY